ncbi:hypothetical protein C8T65DRAFT_824951 [Cerioporus squamosus]|nr:hypothetical protein C8T65DRAFT_824951 [Cerioporus squamosus]
MAVSDIGLPLSHFQDSKQPVELVRDAHEAHYQAYTRCKRIHRDISGGNIVIVPRLLVNPGFMDNSISQCHIVWQGMLSDWETSKPVAEAGVQAQIPARQPERTRDPTHVVTIADKTESFFNVLLRAAMEYVQLTPEDAARLFVQEYLNRYFKENGVRIGGGVKKTVITSGTLSAYTYSSNDEPITFGTREAPNAVINELVFTLLKMFSARYAVLNYERHRRRSLDTTPSDASDPKLNTPSHRAGRWKSSSSSRSAMSGSSSTSSISSLSTTSGGRGSPTRAASGEEEGRLPEGVVPSSLTIHYPHPVGGTSSMKKPCQETKELAEKLATHEEVRNLLWTVTTLEPHVSKWPTNDRKQATADRSPTPPPKSLVATISASDATSAGVEDCRYHPWQYRPDADRA